MTIVNHVIAGSWLPQLSLLGGDLGPMLDMPGDGLSVNHLVDILGTVEERVFREEIHTDALHGEAVVVLRSGGTYDFTGHMRATGFLSFHYRLQVFVDAVGARVALQTDGRVFGSDTPGDQERRWHVSGTYMGLRDLWPIMRRQAQFTTSLDKELSGLTGGVVDVATVAALAFAAAHAFGPIGVVLVLGAEAGSASGVTIGNPNVLAGLTVGAGVLLVCGPAGLIPALVAGTATAALTGVQCRSMHDDEIAFAARVFGNTLPIDRIVLTNLYSPISDPATQVEREFVYPAIDGSIQVNLGRNFDKPLGGDRNTNRSAYPRPGEVLIHELVHAWQIKFRTFLPCFICEAVVNRDYGTKAALQARADRGESWGRFSVEQQATLVNQWFSDHGDNLESTAALTDSRFEYIRENIWKGHA